MGSAISHCHSFCQQKGENKVAESAKEVEWDRSVHKRTSDKEKCTIGTTCTGIEKGKADYGNMDEERLSFLKISTGVDLYKVIKISCAQDFVDNGLPEMSPRYPAPAGSQIS